MAPRKRWRAKREEELRGTPYDSLLEKRLHETTLSDASFHCKDDFVSYTVPHTYEPDFTIEKNGKKYYIETKGRFQDSSEARKYLFIREHLQNNSELVFVFEKATTRFPFAKKRKDGTYRLQTEWAKEKGFRFWTKDNFNLEYLFDEQSIEGTD